MTLSVACLLTVLAAEPAALKRFEATEAHMGTRFGMVLYAADEAAAVQGFRAAFRRIGELDHALSDYDPESELSRLSQSSPTPAPVSVSHDLGRVLAYAQELSQQTDGAFDVTVGPLTRLWRRSRRQRELPSEALLAEARQATGYRAMQVDAAASTVQLLRPKMRLDLGAIAKGYAADEALAALKELGISRALINAGGEVVTGDAPPEQAGWRIGIAPLEPQAPPSRFLLLSNAAVATSGDGWQFVEIGGVRYSHIVDPRTGLGLTRRSSVSVIAPTGMLADCLSTAVSVLGADAGLALIEKTPHTSALVLQLDDGGQLQEFASSGFKQSIAAAPAPDR